jgi:hypothetical protein
MGDQYDDELYVIERPVGTDRLVVIYANQDVSEQIDPEVLLTKVTADASERAKSGWQLLSVGSIPMRQAGTVGNVLSRSGGQYTTQVAVTAVYARNNGAGQG